MTCQAQAFVPCSYDKKWALTLVCFKLHIEIFICCDVSLHQVVMVIVQSRFSNAEVGIQ